MNETLKIILEVVGIVVVGVIIIITGSYFFQKNVNCPQVSQALGLPYRFNFWASDSGCFINIGNNQWIDVDNYQGVNIKK